MNNIESNRSPINGLEEYASHEPEDAKRTRVEMSQTSADKIYLRSIARIPQVLQKYIMDHLKTNDALSFMMTSKSHWALRGRALTHNAQFAGQLLIQPTLSPHWQAEVSARSESITSISLEKVKGRSSLNYEEVERIRERAPHVRNFDFANMRLDEDGAMDSFVELRKLQTITRWTLTEDTLAIFQRMVQENLQIEHLDIDSDEIEEYRFIDHLIKLPLQSLRLHNNLHFVNADIQKLQAIGTIVLQLGTICLDDDCSNHFQHTLISSFPRLERLNIGAGILPHNKSMLQKLVAGNFPRLQSFRFNQRHKDEWLSQEDVAQFLLKAKEQFPLLCEIDIDIFSDKCAEILSNFGRALQIESIHTPEMTDEALLTLSRTNHQIRHLHLQSPTDKCLQELSKGTWKIEKLTIHNGGCISDVAISALARSNLAITELLIENSSNITDEGALALGKGLLPLTSLSITTASERLTKASADHLSSIPTLSSLVLKRANAVIFNSSPISFGQPFTPSDTSLKILSRSSLNVYRIYARWIATDDARITDEGLKMLASSSSFNVGNITLEKGHHITDAGIKALAQSKLDLKHLEIHDSSITDDGAQLLALSKLPLKSLIIYSNRLTEDAKFQLCKIQTLGSLTIINDKGSSKYYATELQQMAKVDDFFNQAN